MTRIFCIFLAIVFFLQTIAFAYNWYTNVPADGLVWFYAIWGCIFFFVQSVRDAIRGEA